MTAAMYCARAGLDCVLVEMLSPGGQMAQTEHLENYPGFNQSTSGFELSEIMSDQVATFGVQTIIDEVKAVDLTSRPIKVVLEAGELLARAVVIATGARPARLGVEGESTYLGSGVSYCATCDGAFFRGRDVCVVGGGDTAVADAAYLSRLCSKVTVIVRRDKLTANALSQKKLAALENVDLIWNTVVDEIEGDDGAVTGVKVRNLLTGEVCTHACAGVFVAIGTVANTEFLGGQLALDSAGHILTDSVCKTSLEGVYAAGDVREKRLYQVTTAVADGANAGEALAEYVMGLS